MLSRLSPMIPVHTRRGKVQWLVDMDVEANVEMHCVSTSTKAYLRAMAWGIIWVIHKSIQVHQSQPGHT